nr:Conidial development protein fluffy [Colletotrichum truncatum]KAF6788417.1 Conidial development protein fluffy [Colletotrichum truncatum]
MKAKVPLRPLSKSSSKRKPRSCISKACETCRAKKAKCSGGKPCSRCKSRGLGCAYETRSSRTKQSLRLEIEELKEAQRQREALIKELTGPHEVSNILARVRDEDTRDSVSSKTLQDQEASCCSVSSQVQTNRLDQAQSSPKYLYPAIFNNPETRYLQTSYIEQTPLPASYTYQPDDVNPLQNFGNFVSTSNYNDFGVNFSLTPSLEITTASYNPIIDHLNYYSSNIYLGEDLGVGNGLAQSISDLMPLSLSNDSIDLVSSHYPRSFLEASLVPEVD